MACRWFAPAGVAVALLVAPAAGQSTAGKAATSTKAWTIPRTPDGRPDLQGMWTNATLTPIERSAQFAGTADLAGADAEAYQRQRAGASNRDSRSASAAADLSIGFNDAFYESGTRLATVDGVQRTSLIVDPPNGRIPSLTPTAKRMLDEANAELQKHPADSAQDRNLDERCLLRGTAGPPMFPQTYNNNYQIVQTPGYVMILVENMHDVRIVPLDGRPHRPATIRPWLGDSVGHWEGDTLVVDTTNFISNMRIGFRNWPSSDTLHVVERFTRTGPDTILYKVTIEDPSTFTRPWTAEIPFVAMADKIYEYACHEGNYALVNILRGARAEEKRAEEAAKTGPR